MKLNEEIIAFKWHLGNAIAQWGYVEGQLLRIALACVAHTEHPALSITYHSIDNARAKLKVCDNLVLHKFGRSKHFAKWTLCKERVEALAKRRNTIAHGWHKLYVHNKSGERWAIIQFHHEDGELVNADGAKPPRGSICLRELALIQLEFHALTTQLCNAHELLCGRRAPFPESDEQVVHRPTIRSIENQMRAELGRRPRPLGKLPSQEKS